jgi:hypothetical protein
LHRHGCDVERCPYCGGQLLFFLCCEDAFDGVPDDDRLPWTGEWPGEAECREFGWYCTWVPDNPPGERWVRCAPDDPGAGPNLSRLRTDAIWDREQKRWVLHSFRPSQELP